MVSCFCFCNQCEQRANKQVEITKRKWKIKSPRIKLRKYIIQIWPKRYYWTGKYHWLLHLKMNTWKEGKFILTATDLPETERQKTPGSLYHILRFFANRFFANRFCELHDSYVCIFYLLNSQKRFSFIEYGTRSQEFSVFLFLADL